MKNGIEEISTQFAALVEQSSRARANPLVYQKVRWRRDEIRQNYSTQRVAHQVSAFEQRSRKPYTQKARSTCNQDPHDFSLSQ